jgi:hypothetical protein
MAAEVFTLQREPTWHGSVCGHSHKLTALCFSYQVMGSYCLKMEVTTKANLWMEKLLGKAASTGPGQVSTGQRWAADSVPVNPPRVNGHTECCV